MKTELTQGSLRKEHHAALYLPKTVRGEQGLLIKHYLLLISNLNLLGCSGFGFAKSVRHLSHLSPRFRLQLTIRLQLTKAESSSSRYQTPLKKQNKQKKSQYPVPGILTTLLLGSQRQRPSNQASSK